MFKFKLSVKNHLVDAYSCINVIFPMFLGYTIYRLEKYDLLNHNISNYLPDGLWSYSFTSMMLIIWNRTINYFWLSIICICFILLETLQFTNIINGTGDILDIFIYLIFCLLSILSNKFMK
jgi:hypothetical protein